jgi:phage gp29-like protein
MPDYYSVTDYLGRPIEKSSLLQTLARANVMGVRQAVSSGASRGITPQRLASILREAEDGDPSRYMELAGEMEKTDLHYLSVLGTRKRQVAQLDITVEAAGTDDKESPDYDPNDQANADLVNRMNDTGIIDEWIFDGLDAVGKGFSVSETMWDMGSSLWMPRAIELVDPRFIDWDRETRRRPLLIGNAGERLELTPGKFLFLQIKASSDISVRVGIAYSAAFNWMCKNYTIKDWMQFGEIYGMPFRTGKYPQGSSEDDINALLRAVTQMGVDAAAVIPQSMMIELVRAEGSSMGHLLYQGMADYFDKQTSKVVLGQTGTTDATPGQLGSGQDHTEVRRDIEVADARAVEACLNRQLIRPFIDLNRGPQKRYPWLYIGRPESKDAKLMADIAAVLVPMGAKIEARQITSAAGFSDPGKGAELLTPAAQGYSLPFSSGGQQPNNPLPATARAQSVRALLAALAGTTPDAIERAAHDQAGDWVVLDPAVEQIAKVLASAKDGDDAMARLQKLAGNIDMSGLGDRMSGLNLQALAAGLLGDKLK